MRPAPIPPASEPLQYRAIGLVRGRYQPDPEVFTKGTLIANDGVSLDAVLLGRVLSLVKKHIDLSQEHLWVVYPRTRDREGGLHMQIVGLWEPEMLTKRSQLTPGIRPPSPPKLQVSENFFSIRGEVVFTRPDLQRIVVRISQQAKTEPGERPAGFKLVLKGNLDLRALHHFWDFQVERQGEALVVRQAEAVAALPGRRPKPKPQLRGQGQTDRRPPNPAGYSGQGDEARPQRSPLPRRVDQRDRPRPQTSGQKAPRPIKSVRLPSADAGSPEEA